MSQHRDSPYPERKNETGSTPTPGAPPAQDGVPFTTVYTQPYTQPLPAYQQPYIPPHSGYQQTYYGTPVEVSSTRYFDLDDYRANWDSATTGALIVFLM